MKIIIVGPAYPYRGGLAAFNERLARQFTDEGHEVEVLTFTLQYPSFLFPGKTQYSTAEAPENIKIYRKINSLNPLNWIKAGKEIKKRRPDMVIFAYWMSFFAPCYGTAARLCANAGIRRMALVHNMIPHEPTLLDKLFPGYFVKNMDAFVALSSSVIGDIAKFDKKNKPKKMSPHPLYDHYGELMPRQEAAKKLALNAEKQYVLFFGFIRKYKGLDLLLEAFADERLRKYPVKLIVAGEFYENEQFYADLIARLQLAGLVELRTEFIPDDEVKYYFSAADIVAQPYRSATQSGVSQIACHFEKPVLVTNVGGLSEMIPDGKVGYVVAPSSGEIAGALADFFENKREKIFSKNMQEEKKKYAWSEMTNAFYELSKQLK
jgi:glycosyltransferase involved in cell wall biosynthesis